nr:EOG090X005Q [Daphnia magna]
MGGKAFDITYIRVKFQSPRPESFALYKRTSEDGPWLPYQFYSATCRDTYGLPDSNFVRRDDEKRALCTSEFSDISPLTGGNVAFSTLEGRPSAYNFDESKELQDFVTATDIRITLDRLNTFGDEVFGDPKVLKSYFYAISDFAVGGRCKCNGHASECVSSSSEDGSYSNLVCRCEHNTAGRDCQECLPFYNDRPWARATADDANECLPCNCNGFSSRCYFDQALFDSTGHGGHCLDCTANRDGPNCERCREQFYQREDNYCVPCNCDETGSRSLQCNREGKCSCKPGVTGDKCDRCEENFYDFGPQGCRPCGCNVAGSLGGQPRCDSETGSCSCKDNVEGQRCDRAKPGYFNLDAENLFGATPCFCYGHSSVCRSATGYARGLTESVFARSDEKWTALEQPGNRPITLAYNSLLGNIGVSAPGRDAVVFSAPERYLHDQRTSYNQQLHFTLRTNEAGARASIDDVVLEGSGLTISQPIFGQGNQLPSTQNQVYSFRLHEHPDYGWNPRLSSRDFISVLANLTAIRIRGSYTPRGSGYLDDVKLETARRGGSGSPANWIERCNCPEGYVGQFCESCAPGFRHEPANGGPFARCVPCNCNGHADICDAESGRCICQHNTAGDNCERCARGFYGNALQGSPNDCQACPCPNGGACIELADETVVCLECPVGYAGPRCELCSDGYFGDPEGRFGARRPCQPCDCNGNVDPNAVGNCNRTTGECLKCIYNTAGYRCDSCLAGFFGDALALNKGDCRPCQCFRRGTLQLPSGTLQCDQVSGQCECKPNVAGNNCDRCQDGFFDLESGNGCQTCNCDPVGSLNRTCNVRSGQCFCRPGVVGLRCDSCAPNQFGFSYNGCKPCECDTIGSLSLQCDDPDGQCRCRDNVEGRRCDRCKENKHDREAGCKDCPPCYNLVQEAVDEHRAKLTDLATILERIISNPTIIADLDFDRKLAEVQDRVDQLWVDAKLQSGGDKSISIQLEELKNRLKQVQLMIGEIEMRTQSSRRATAAGIGNLTVAEAAVERARDSLKAAQRYLETEGSDALQRAIQRSEKFGQQSERMSQIARDARQAADQLDEAAVLIESTAQEALNTSSNAYQLAREAVDQQKNTTEEIDGLRRELTITEQTLARTQAMAKEALTNAQSAYTEALSLLGDAYSLVVPNVEWQFMKRQAAQHSEEARRIKAEADQLTSDNSNMLDEVSDQIIGAGDVLAKGVAQQQIADELLADADVALGRSQEAVSLGDKTLQEAQKTLETLEGFDSLVQESKEKARDALGQVGEIKNLIEQAEERTREAQNALAGAESDARVARDSANQAQEHAEQASKDAVLIRQGASETRDKAGQLKDTAESLTSSVADTANRMRTLEAEAAEDQGLAKEALEKANQAKSISADSTVKVREAISAVNEILISLNNMGNIDTAALDELERKLIIAERDFIESDIERRIEEMRTARVTQNQWVRDYEEELARLRLEVDNVEAIKEALPDGCWKRLKLEP